MLYGWRRVDDPTIRRFKIAYSEVPRKNGKALALDTPIPTPDGLKTMGELEVGDNVFGPDGNPCRVTGTSEVFTDHDCYELTFSDGTKITADADHLWAVHARRTGRPPPAKMKGWTREEMRCPDVLIKTTSEIAESTNVGNRTGVCERNYKIENCGVLQFPDC